jgi:hypothetical protein
MIITAGVVAMGIAVLYWAYSWGKVANMQYSDSITAGSNAIGERIAFEYITYSSLSNNLTVNMINWGKTNNVSIARVYLWDSSHQPIGTYPDEVNPELVLMNITTNTRIPSNTLNIGDEGYFNVTTLTTLPLNSYYNIRIVTERGRNFDGSFATP